MRRTLPRRGSLPGLAQAAIDDGDGVRVDSERVELVARDPSRVGGVVARRKVDGTRRRGEKLVDRVRVPFAIDGYGSERADDAHAKRRLLPHLAHRRGLEGLVRLDVSARQGPGAETRRPPAPHEKDPPCVVDHDGADGERAASLVLRTHGPAGIVAAMLGRELAVPLEVDWQDTLDGVARARGWPTSRDVSRLAARVAELSEAYNDPDRARASARDAGAARLGFVFPRDVPKGAASVRELVATGALRLAPDAPLRVLDVGAGMGAMTWGIVRALEASRPRGVTGRVDATWVDAEPLALEVGAAVVGARAGRQAIDLRVRLLRRQAESLDDLGTFDVVVLGHVLSELDVGLDADARVARHVEVVRSLLDRLAPAGSLVVVEPALRARTRHLHRIRDACVAEGVTVFAPCLHRRPCPALARESDWCHEDLPVDLPPWLVPVARAAGLRREGLTFSYVVLRNDGVSLVGAIPVRAGAARLRVVSGLIPSKGKREAYLCGTFAEEAGRARSVRLDRDANEANAEWERVQRGDVLEVDPSPELDRARIGARTNVRSVRRTWDGESR